MSRQGLHADRVSWSAGGRVVVDDVHLVAAPGSTIGLLGPNGSGKSSLLRLLAGLRPTSSGVVRLGEEDVARMSRRTVARRLALVDQERSVDTEPSVADVIGLGRLPHRPPWAPVSARDVEVVRRCAATTRTEHLLERRYSTLSGGERQRVQIARALAQEPTELLLDEPTNHLDVRHQLELLALVAAAETTTVMALHDLNLAAEHCDQLVLLQHGRVRAAGPPTAVVTRDLVAEVFDVEAVVTVDDGTPHVRFLRAR
ncbi:ABC transporter ATP-binding protein [Aeromicrobium halocynthiae]|uniref:ABC transporter ATP-binding protein n=1 Tax=Aeromicrobium halocynthiae TaxID=560557 RepID=A0ABN2VVS7_9ACTN